MRTILVIEDNHLTQEFYCEVLFQEGYQVIGAFTGDEGLAKIEKFKPDLLILDMNIPGMSGRTVLLEIKKIAKNLPILIISGKVGMQNDPEICLSNQVRKFLVKPVQVADLVKVVQDILGEESSAPSASWRGKKLGGCVLQEYLGGGGSGMVYKGMRGDIEVAVKILSKNLRTQEEEVARFHREATLLAKVQHPNIIGIVGMGVEEGVHFIVMRYFKGESLDALQRKGPRLPLREMLDLIKQVALGMAATHKIGLIHRDLKPSNIIYNRELKLVKVIDFGLARRIEEDQLITRQGFVVGTPLYMSPEQCQGLQLDEKADVYSLGISFYQLITGAVPFHGNNTMQTLLAQIYDPVPWPSERASAAPGYVQEVLNKMLHKKPEERCTMEEVAQALAEHL